MNTYYFHINLYDVAFLGGIFIALAFAALLWFAKRKNSTANRFLALALVTIALWLAKILGTDIGLSAYIPGWNRLPLQFSLAIGPLIYFNVLKITRPAFKLRVKHLWHFSPLLFELGMWFFEDTPLLHQAGPLLQLPVFISITIYVYLSCKLIDRFYRRMEFNGGDRYRLALRWLHSSLKSLGLLWLLWIPITIAGYFYYQHLSGIQVYYPLFLLLLVMTAWTAAAAFLNSESVEPAEAQLFIKQLLPADIKQKGNWLRRTVKENRYYQDPELNLSSLAEKLGLHHHELSRIINVALKKNFNDFINEYRVRDVAAKMQDPAYNHITLLGMAYDAGFNSKATFIRSFKQFTGKNPAVYKRELEKEVATYHLQPLFRSAAIISGQETTHKWSHHQLNRSNMFKNYFKIAWRSISRNRVYTGINVLGLSLGVCACLIIYLITSFELSYDTFHPDKDRIYRIVVSMQNEHGDKRDMAFLISALPIAARNEVSGFEDATAFYNYFPKVTVPGNDNITRKFEAPKEGEASSPVIVAEPQYFKIFKYRWLQGDPSTALNEPFKVVLSEQEAYKYFGSKPLEKIIGKEVIYNDSLRLTVSGVVEDWKGNTDFAFKDFISFATVQHSFLKNDIDLRSWGMWDYNSQGYVKLANGVTPAVVEKRFAQFVKAHIKVEEGSKVELKLQPLSDIHFNNNYQDAYSRQAHLPTLYGLMAVAVFILIIAAINFINLSTAQSLRRAKEVGVRKVLGSSKTNLTLQFLIETFIVTAAALIIAVAFTNPLISVFHSFIPQGVRLSFFSLPALLFLVGMLVMTCLLAGFYPARILSSYLPALSLKGQGAPQLGGKGYLRKTLIVFQFTVSLIFIIGTLVVGSQVRFILNKDLGFDKDAIITIHTGWNTTVDQVGVFFNKVKEIPNIRLASMHHETPAAQRHGGTIIYRKGEESSKIDASFDFCDENYVPLFGLKIIAGRNLSHSDTIREYLVNETCAKALGYKNPQDAVGKFVEIGTPNSARQIAGVVKDFNSKSLHEVITPFFMASNKRGERSVSLKLATGRNISNFKATLAQVSRAWKEVYPNNKFEFTFLDQTIAGFYDKEQKTAQLMNTAMLIAIFISCMGLFGLVTFTAQQRVKEIGIRKVLGASVTSIVSMLSRDFLWLIIISLLIASPIAYYFMHTWLQGFAYRVNISLWLFLLSGLVAIVIAFATVSFQAIKAALVNPVKSLRNE